MRHTVLSIIASLLFVVGPAFAQADFVPPKLDIVRVAPLSDAEQLEQHKAIAGSVLDATACTTAYSGMSANYCIMRATNALGVDPRIDAAKTACTELSVDTPAAQRNASYAWCMRQRLEPIYAVTLDTDISQEK